VLVGCKGEQPNSKKEERKENEIIFFPFSEKGFEMNFCPNLVKP